MNKVIEALTLQNYVNFRDSFINVKNIFWDEAKSKLTHPGEFGEYREEIAKNWLKMYVPERYGIGSGFVIGSDNTVSTQCDLIIYDVQKTPKIENTQEQRFYPIETVCAVGEIKSDIGSLGKLKSHLIKLSQLKRMRENVPTPTPYHRVFDSQYSASHNSFDNIFTFLICNKFNFKASPEKVDYGKIEQKYKHNMVLSLQDGLLLYRKNQKGKSSLAFPLAGHLDHCNLFIATDETELPDSVKTFLIFLSHAVDMTTMLNIDMTHYLSEKFSNTIK
jgi:hypothetical protein